MPKSIAEEQNTALQKTNRATESQDTLIAKFYMELATIQALINNNRHDLASVMINNVVEPSFLRAFSVISSMNYFDKSARESWQEKVRPFTDALWLIFRTRNIPEEAIWAMDIFAYATVRTSDFNRVVEFVYYDIKNPGEINDRFQVELAIKTLRDANINTDKESLRSYFELRTAELPAVVMVDALMKPAPAPQDLLDEGIEDSTVDTNVAKAANWLIEKFKDTADIQTCLNILKEYIQLEFLEGGFPSMNSLLDMFLTSSMNLGNVKKAIILVALESGVKEAFNSGKSIRRKFAARFTMLLDNKSVAEVVNSLAGEGAYYEMVRFVTSDADKLPADNNAGYES